jgi:hypothetical protein
MELGGQLYALVIPPWGKSFAVHNEQEAGTARRQVSGEDNNLLPPGIVDQPVACRSFN